VNIQHFCFPHRKFFFDPDYKDDDEANGKGISSLLPNQDVDALLDIDEGEQPANAAGGEDIEALLDAMPNLTREEAMMRRLCINIICL